MSYKSRPGGWRIEIEFCKDEDCKGVIENGKCVKCGKEKE